MPPGTRSRRRLAVGAARYPMPMATLERVTPYLETLLGDDDVKDNLRRAGARFGQATRRAGKRRSRRAAIKDPGVRQRAREGAAYALAALSALNQAPERRAPSHRLRWALVVLVLAAAAFAAYDERTRGTVLEAAGKLRDATSSDGAGPEEAPA
jgi:hypothetical protein